LYIWGVPPLFTLDVRATCAKCGRLRDVVLDTRKEAELAPVQETGADAPLRYRTVVPCVCGAKIVKAALDVDMAE
jgi:hypothetical protein